MSLLCGPSWGYEAGNEFSTGSNEHALAHLNVIS